jgi:hypothetical protein
MVLKKDKSIRRCDLTTTTLNVRHKIAVADARLLSDPDEGNLLPNPTDVFHRLLANTKHLGCLPIGERPQILREVQDGLLKGDRR